MIEIRRDEQNGFRLEGEATIHDAIELREKLLEVLASTASPTVLDLSGLTDLDTAGAQVLLAFVKSAPSVVLVSCPDPVAASLASLGLAKSLLEDRRAHHGQDDSRR